ncbi:MAG: FKBP-type peptidyl-prolyl cis-trans isomerase [Bacteroidales bacterium]|nr:FKBP-type peptidyl-prolyl cis-trans isomerase [Bacteroidales bacterium]
MNTNTDEQIAGSHKVSGQAIRPLKTNFVRMKYLLLVIVSVTVFSGCKKDDDTDWAVVDDGIIKEYLEENNLTATKHTSGLYYNIKKQGYGGSPNYYSTIEVVYKGYLTDGSIFDQTSPGLTFKRTLSSLITGWQIGLPMLQRGGSATFYIPSTLGYGSTEKPNIPKNSVLIFDITLVDFE